jgi:hypothetical protein
LAAPESLSYYRGSQIQALELFRLTRRMLTSRLDKVTRKSIGFGSGRIGVLLHRKSEHYYKKRHARGARGCAAFLGALIIVSLAPLVSASGGSQSSGTANRSQGPQMDAQTKANAFHQVLKSMAAGEKINPQLWNEFVAAQNDDLQTGPGVGKKVPDFTLPDQYGKERSLNELMGRQGLLLVFTRSADW